MLGSSQGQNCRGGYGEEDGRKEQIWKRNYVRKLDGESNKEEVENLLQS